MYWVDINLAQKKGLKFYQTRSNAIILHETLPAYCIPKVVRMETGAVKNEKVFASPRPPPKISLKHDWMKALGSASCWTWRKLPTDPNPRLEQGDLLRQNKRPVRVKAGQLSQSNDSKNIDMTKDWEHLQHFTNKFGCEKSQQDMGGLWLTKREWLCVYRCAEKKKLRLDRSRNAGKAKSQNDVQNGGQEHRLTEGICKGRA